MLSLISCVLYAAAATLFYKKNIRRQNLPAVLMLTLIGTCVQCLHGGEVTMACIIVIVAGVIYTRATFDVNWIQSAVKFDLFVAFALAIAEIQFGHIEQCTNVFATFCETFTGFEQFSDNMTKVIPQSEDNPFTTQSTTMYSTMFGVSYFTNALNGLWRKLPAWPVLRIILVAIPQFVRRPIALKAKLQGLRSKLGPMYVLFTAVYVWQVIFHQKEHFFRLLCWLLVVMAAAFAGILTRPDNPTMCDLFGLPSSYRCRKLFHRTLMIASFVCVLLLTVF